MTSMPSGHSIPPLSVRSIIYLAVAFVAVAAAATLGSQATAPHLAGWYAGLAKPWFNPPNWVFPVAWTSLFALMAFGFWRVLRSIFAGAARTRAIIAFLVQLGFNVAWSFAFFGQQSPDLGLAVAIGLVAAVGALVVSFLAVDRLSGLLQLPYLAWVTFALILNAAIVTLN